MSSHALRRPPVRLNCAGTVVLVGRSTLTMSGSALLARIGAGDSDDAFLDRSPQNVQAVLESKQAVESNRIFAEIRKNLTQATFSNKPATAHVGTGGPKTPTAMQKSRDGDQDQFVAE